MANPAPNFVNPKGFNLLALDGGGIKGVCSAMIVRELIRKVEELQDTPGAERHPADLFDLAAGTSTGGIIATMLFRLRMDPEQVVKSYGEFGSAVFSPKIGKIELKSWGPIGNLMSSAYLWTKALIGGARHATGDILKVVDNLVSKSKFAADIEAMGASKLLVEFDQDVDPSKPSVRPGKMLVCATKTDESETVTFRNYIPPDEVVPEYRDITIRDALCATTAAPLYMPKTIVHVAEKDTDTFWDGGLLNNNPVFQLWAARFDLLPALAVTDTASTIPNVKTVVSVGCGKSRNPPKMPSTMTGTVGSVVGYATNTWARHVDFLRDVRRENLRMIPRQRTHYFRFEPEPVDGHPEDVDPGSVAIDDYKQLENLTTLAEHWLAQPKVQEKLACCAKYLLNQNVSAENCKCDACAKPGIPVQVFVGVGKDAKAKAGAKNGKQ